MTNVVGALWSSESLVLTFSSRSSGPHFAAVNRNNQIVLSDFHNHYVKVTHSLQFSHVQFPGPGDTPSKTYINIIIILM